MKWTPQQIALPIMIGITGASIALIYFLYKKDEEEDNPRKTNTARSHQKTLEISIPKQFVPAIIGRRGTTIRDLESKTSTQIHFSDDSIDNPNRICKIKGITEGIRLAEEMIKNIIENQPVIETYEMFIPQRVHVKLTGKGYDTIRHIQSSSNTKIILDKSPSSDQNADKRIIIRGTAEQIANALSQIEDIVHKENRALSEMKDNLHCRVPRGRISPCETPDNRSENSLQFKELPAIQAIDGLIDVYVSAMETPNQFWIQVVGPGTSSLDSLVSEMTAYYSVDENRELHILKNITVGQIVAAQFMDNRWYRAEILTVLEDGGCMAYFVDYGDQQTYAHNDIKDGILVLELRTDFLSLRQQAIECSLANVKPRDGQWSDEALDRFAELSSLAQWKVLVAKVRGYKERILSYGKSRREGSPIPRVDLYDQSESKDLNVGKILVEEGLAEVEEGTWSAASSTLSLSKRAHDFSTSPTSITPTSNTPTARRALSPEMIDSDLTPPRRAREERVEVIDLVTPAKHVGNTVMKNGTTHKTEQLRRDEKPKNIAPAGYESDLSADSDELELG